MALKHAGDMGSEAATWAGPGAPPQLTAGDTMTMSAPRAGFDPTLNPGGDAVESSHTVKVKAAEDKLKAAEAKASAKSAKALAQGPEPKPVSTKEAANAKAAEPLVKKTHQSEKDANHDANDKERKVA